MPRGFSNVVTCMPRLGCAFMALFSDSGPAVGTDFRPGHSETTVIVSTETIIKAHCIMNARDPGPSKLAPRLGQPLPDHAQLDLEHFLPYRLSVLSNRVSGTIARIYTE